MLRSRRRCRGWTTSGVPTTGYSWLWWGRSLQRLHGLHQRLQHWKWGWCYRKYFETADYLGHHFPSSLLWAPRGPGKQCESWFNRVNIVKAHNKNRLSNSRKFNSAHYNDTKSNSSRMKWIRTQPNLLTVQLFWSVMESDTTTTCIRRLKASPLLTERKLIFISSATSLILLSWSSSWNKLSRIMNTK